MGIKPVDPFLYFGIFAGFLPLLADFPYKYYRGGKEKRSGFFQTSHSQSCEELFQQFWVHWNPEDLNFEAQTK